MLTGWVETDPDALRADDRRYFAVLVEPPPNVALSAGQPFLEEALSVLEDAGRLRRTSVALSDVAILPGAIGLEALPPGRAAVILPPASALELPAVNRRLGEAALAWRFAAAPATGEARFADIASSDPVLASLAGTRLHRVYALQRPGDATETADSTLLSLADGSPWAVRGLRAGGGSYVILGSPLDGQATTLPTSAAMLPLLDRLIGAWSATGSRALDVAAGETVRLPAGAVTLEDPDGVRESLAERTDWTAEGEPGLYRVLGAGDSALTVFAVNPPAAESRLDRIDARELRRSLASWDPIVIDSDGAWERQVYRRRLGRELWRPFLLVALGLLVAEGLLAAAGRAAGRAGRREATASPTPSEAGVS